MTLDERIDMAADEYRRLKAPTSHATVRWQALNGGLRSYYRAYAELVVRAFTPELFSDPPTGWIAPWTMPADVVIDSDEWVQMRDEYLHHYPMKPTEATKEEPT